MSRFLSQDISNDDVVTHLKNLQDLNISNVKDNNILTYNKAHGKWENVPGLQVVNPTNTQLLQYNATIGAFQNVNAGAAINVKISACGDVDESLASDNDMLLFNSTTQKWTSTHNLPQSQVTNLKQVYQIKLI